MLYCAYGRTQRKESSERHHPLDHYRGSGGFVDLLVSKAEIADWGLGKFRVRAHAICARTAFIHSLFFSDNLRAHGFVFPHDPCERTLARPSKPSVLPQGGQKSNIALPSWKAGILLLGVRFGF